MDPKDNRLDEISVPIDAPDYSVTADLPAGGEWIQIEALQRVRLEPGDTLVLMHPGALTLDTVAGLRSSLSRAFPDNRVLVLEDGMKLAVISAGDSDSNG